jgi:hypothetical protein
LTALSGKPNKVTWASTVSGLSLIGRITALGPAFMMVGVVRVGMPSDLSTSAFHLGDAVTVTATGNEVLVAENVVLGNPTISDEPPFL